MIFSLIVSATCAIISLSTSTCYQFPKVTSPQYYIPVVKFGVNHQSIVYTTENNSDNTLINTFISNLYADQHVIIFSGEGNVNEKEVFYLEPNLIIFMKELTEDILTLSLSKILRSRWSPVYLILTDKSVNQICENGALNPAKFDYIQEFMNTIWITYQIIRVVVVFPYTCPHRYVIYDGKKPTNSDLYIRTIKLIKATHINELKAALKKNTDIRKLTEGYPLKANIFYRFPTSIKDCNGINQYVKMNFNYTNGYCGMDGLVMHEFVKYFKFNVTVPSNNDCNEYGFVTPDTGNVTGSLGCVVKKHVDISFNSRFMMGYRTDFYHYLHYISTDSLAVVLQRPEVIPLWKYAYNSYSPRIAIGLIIIIVVLGLMTWYLTWIVRGISKQKPKNIYVYIGNAFMCTLFGIPIEKGSERFRVLRATSLVCSIILLASYQSCVSKQFTTLTRVSELKTLQELYHSKFLMYTSPSIKELLMTLANPADKAQVEYFHRTKLKSENISTECILQYADAATLVRGEDVLIEILLNFTDKNGSPIIYKIEEAIHVYYLSYIARPGFLFVEQSRSFMMRFLEAGLPNRYYIWTRQVLKLGDPHGKTNIEPRPIAKTQLNDLRIAFYLLAFGYILSTCSFIVEKYLYKRFYVV